VVFEIFVVFTKGLIDKVVKLSSGKVKFIPGEVRLNTGEPERTDTRNATINTITPTKIKMAITVVFRLENLTKKDFFSLFFLCRDAETGIFSLLYKSLVYEKDIFVGGSSIFPIEISGVIT